MNHQSFKHEIDHGTKERCIPFCYYSCHWIIILYICSSPNYAFLKGLTDQHPYLPKLTGGLNVRRIHPSSGLIGQADLPNQAPNRDTCLNRAPNRALCRTEPPLPNRTPNRGTWPNRVPNLALCRTEHPLLNWAHIVELMSSTTLAMGRTSGFEPSRANSAKPRGFGGCCQPCLTCQKQHQATCTRIT